jgi:uncharacterized membrane protein YphA (DoxX/SURF4 family)
MMAVIPSPAMQAVGVLVLVSASLLAVGGVAKVLRPLSAVLAMRAIGLPSGTLLVRLLGIAEIAVAVWVILTAAPIAAALMGVAYLAFAGFVAVAMRSADRRSCGCFGEASTPPGVAHIVVDLAAAMVSAAAVIGEVPSLSDMLSDGFFESALIVAGSALAVYLLIAVLTTLPQAMRAVADVAAGADRS